VLTPQGRIRHQGRTGRLDETLGPRFVLACTEEPDSVLDADRRAFLDAIGAAVLHLVPASDGADAAADGEGTAAVDGDGVYLPHMREAGHVAALVRPTTTCSAPRRPRPTSPTWSTTCAAS
jgi:flavoprotein hydroxylase